MVTFSITALLIVSLFLILASGVLLGLTLLAAVVWIGMPLFSSRPAGRRAGRT